MIKKLQRVKLGGIDTGSSYTSKDITTEMLSEEIGGIAIYLDLLASLLNISLEGAIIYEFNRVSSKYNLQEFLSSPAKVEGDAVEFADWNNMFLKDWSIVGMNHYRM